LMRPRSEESGFSEERPVPLPLLALRKLWLRGAHTDGA
jgi:hypothetical protein